MMKVLMCAPTHYAIRYEINPWMKLENAINPQRATDQWRDLRRVLQKLGIQVVTIPQKEGCPDMVFTANAGVVSGKTFIPSRFRYSQRRLEESAFIQFFKKKGFAVRDAVTPAAGDFFEGEGDLLPYRDKVFGGFSFRSTERAQKQVSAAMHKRLVALRLVNSHFYHLDTCFFPINDDTVLYYPAAFDAEGRRAIERYVKKAIPVSRADAHAFACNGLSVGKTVVLNRASRGLKGRLARLGYCVLETPTSEFMKAGGSVKCLLLKLCS